MLESAQIGDRVVMKMDREARSWRGGAADGTLGTIMGRNRLVTYSERNRLSYGAISGIYERDSSFIVKFDGIDEPYSTSDDVQLADKKLAEQRRKEYFAIKDYTERTIYFDRVVRIGDLPKTDFYEGDQVEILNANFHTNEECVACISGIEYNWSNVPYQVHWINRETGEYAGRGHTYIRNEGLKLIERGNHWREANGEPLVFKNIAEEISYARETGRAKEMRNPASNLYAWEKEEVLEAIERGEVDGFSMPSLSIKISALRFDNRDLGERVREETLQGFGLGNSFRI